MHVYNGSPVCSVPTVPLHFITLSLMLQQEIFCTLNLVRFKSPLKQITNIYIGISEKFEEMALYMIEKRHIEQASQLKKL